MYILWSLIFEDISVRGLVHWDFAQLNNPAGKQINAETTYSMSMLQEGEVQRTA